MAELGTLQEALDVVRQRTFWNSLLRRLKWPAAGWLLFLVLALALSRSLAWVPIAAAILAAGVILAAYATARRARISHYSAAVQLDCAAELKDRLSTAYYFSDIREPEGFVRRQREDALAHLSRIRPGRLFPFRAPAGSRWGLVLVGIVALLFAYRLKHDAPLGPLASRLAHSQFVKSMVSPVTHAEEKRPAGDRDRRSEQEPGRGPARAGGEDDRQQTADSRGASAEGQPAPGDQKGAPSRSGTSDPGQQRNAQGKDGEGQQSKQGGESETPQEDRGSGRDGSGGQSQQQRGGEGQQQNAGSQSDSGNQQQGENNSGDSSNGGQSLARQMLNALKNLFSRNSNNGQQQAQKQSGQRSQEGSQGSNNSSANAAQQGAQPSQGNQRGSESQSQSASGSQDSGQQKSGTGVGQQPGSNGTDAAQQQSPAGSLSPDRVALETHQFSGEAQVRARMGQGDAHTVAGAAGAPTTARVNGAEQENVPQRYRHYLQRYFDQTAKKRK